jgi:hypothetical protein
VMLGRVVASEGGSVRDIAAPLRPHVSSANVEMATSVPRGRIESLTDRRIWAIADVLIA